MLRNRRQLEELLRKAAEGSKDIELQIPAEIIMQASHKGVGQYGRGEEERDGQRVMKYSCKFEGRTYVSYVPIKPRN